MSEPLPRLLNFADQAMTFPDVDRSPPFPPGLVWPTLRLHNAAEIQIVAGIARLLADDLAAADWPARATARTLKLRRIVDGVVAGLVENGQHLAADAITKAYRQVVPDRRPDGLIERLLLALREFWEQIRATVMRLWSQALAAGQADDTRPVAVQRVLDRAADRGLGPRGGLGSYAETVVGDAVHGAGTDAFTQALLAQGGDLVIVTESPHPCPICLPWEHKVLSVTGTDPDHPALSVAQEAGLFHRNCRHTLFAWAPGFQWPPNIVKHLRGTYEQEQRQRQIEANIRRWKRREAAALDDLAAARSRKKIREWQAAMREHIKATGLQRSLMRERTDFERTPPKRHALAGPPR
jgi:hypothetical protein